MKKRVIFRLADLGAACLILAFALGFIFIGADRPVPELCYELLDYLASCPPELLALLVGILAAGSAIFYMIVDLVVLAELFIKIRQYKRMGIPVGVPEEGASYCDGCPYEAVCNDCPYNPGNPGGYGIG